MLKFMALLLTAAPMLSLADDAELASGGLDKTVIDEHIKKAIPQLRECYLKESQRPGGQKEGRLVMKFLIGSEGKVTEAKADQSSFQSSEVGRCLADVVKGIAFPAPAGGGVVDVSYPFAFNPGADATKKPAAHGKNGKK